MRRRQSRPRFCGGCLHGRSRAADGRAEANATDVRCPDDGRVRTRGAWRSRGADPLNNAAYSIRSARRGRQGRARSAEARPRMAGRRSALDDAAVTCRRRPRCRSRCRRRCATHTDASSPAGPTDEPACHRAARFATQTGTSRAESSSMISPRTRSHTLAQASKPASKVASSIDAALNPDGERRAFNACSDNGFGSRRPTMDAAMRARSG